MPPPADLPYHPHTPLPPARACCRATREAAALACALAARGHEYERALDVRAAVQCFEEACKLVPASVPYLSMAAKCWSDLTFYYDVRTDRERQLVNLKAMEYAEKVRGTLHPPRAGGVRGAAAAYAAVACRCMLLPAAECRPPTCVVHSHSLDRSPSPRPPP